MTPIRAVIALSVALAMTVAVEQSRAQSERRLARTAVAVATITPAPKATVSPSNSLRIAELRAERATARVVALEDSLRRMTSLPSAAIVAAISGRDTVPDRQPTDDVRRAPFNVRQEPDTVSAAVEVPAPPDSAHLALRVAVDPIRLTPRVECSRPDEHGVRTASITADAPPWAVVTFGTLQPSPNVCASSPIISIPSVTMPQGRGIRFAPLMAGIGKIARPGGASSWGWFVGSGITVWD